MRYTALVGVSRVNLAGIDVHALGSASIYRPEVQNSAIIYRVIRSVLVHKQVPVDLLLHGYWALTVNGLKPGTWKNCVLDSNCFVCCPDAGV